MCIYTYILYIQLYTYIIDAHIYTYIHKHTYVCVGYGDARL